ncbi:MAG TPA: GvpL/GvpF family gas vesicle protein [Chloroflexota bacterium]|nr:GvpL/GvpF family gas vesicle protein [Chloroflexota bacterium]
MEGIYLYAITGGTLHLGPDVHGLPDGTTRVSTLTIADLTAVVSPYSGPSFDDLPRAEILQNLLAHQRVLEQVLPEQTVLPVKFGTVLPAERTIEAALERYRPRLTDALHEVGDAVEIDLSVAWDSAAILNEISHEPDVRAMVSAVTGSGQQGDVATQISIGQLVHETLGRRRQELRRSMLDDLLPLARDAEPSPVPADELVLNVAFLVDRPQLREFEATVDRLGTRHGDRLTFRYVGPLPPYSFATVVIGQPNSDEIGSAARALDLGEQFTRGDLRAAYRRRAAETHPDVQPDDTGRQHHFTEITAAHDSLEKYVASLETGSGAGGDVTYDVRPEVLASQVTLRIVRGDESGALET